jgi:hypothetical protein
MENENREPSELVGLGREKAAERLTAAVCFSEEQRMRKCMMRDAAAQGFSCGAAWEGRGVSVELQIRRGFRRFDSKIARKRQAALRAVGGRAGKGR